MHAVAILVAASALAVDYGWKTAEDGQLEYVIQIEPPLLEALKAGEVITSEIDPRVENVRRFRIRVGRQPLPHDVPPSALKSTSARPIDTPDQTAEAGPETPPAGPDIGSDGVAGPDTSAWTATPALETGASEPADGPIPDLVPDPDYLPVVGGMTDDVDVREARFDRSRPGAQDVGSETFSPGTEDGGLPRAGDEGREEGNARRGFGERDMAKQNAPQPEFSEADPVGSARSKPQTDGGERAGTTRRWLPLMVTLLALFASGGLNVYLGWIIFDTHHQCQRLVAQLHRADLEVSPS